jgi:Fic family protein
LDYRVYVATPPPTDGIFGAGSADGERILNAVQAPRDPRSAKGYLHWDKLQYLEPSYGLTAEEWWWRIKLFERRPSLRTLPLADREGVSFKYSLPDLLLRSLHQVDQHCAGEVAMDAVVTSDKQARQRFLVNSLMEEAIRSSQLEGATTSRRRAKEMLRTGRDPQDRSERMILNNYRALQFMHEEMGETLTPASVLELHRILTDGTLDDPSAAGRLQTSDEVRVAVYDRDGGKRLHDPPPADQLPERLATLCDFANEEDGDGIFIHPVVRAVLLHFGLAYDHPFEDGNGRTARILFFWSMRRSGYWLAEYLSISTILRKAPSRYGRAFLETETDEGDTTYFLIHQLGVIERAIEEMQEYLQRKTQEVQEIESLLRGADGFNRRQLELLTNAVRHPDASYSFAGHAAAQRVTHETARADLSDLAKRGLLVQRRLGREYLFEPAVDLPDLLRESGR